MNATTTPALTRRSVLAAGTAGGAALALAACSGGSGGGNGSGGGGAAEPAAATTNEMNPVDYDQVAAGGELRWPLSQIPTNFNYGHLDGTLNDNANVIFACLPRPYAFDAGATPVVNEDYFTSIELTSESPQVVTYTINPEATWSDGTPVTAADFIAQWQANNGTNPAFTISASNGYDQIADVKQGADEKQAVVTFATTYGDWQAIFDPLYPASTNTDPAVFNEGWIEKMPVTAGPFTLEGIDQASQTISLVPDPKWWGRAPKLERITYRVLDSDAQVDALANGEVDYVDLGASASNYQRASTLTGVQVRRAGGPNYRHITFNGGSALLSDVAVRHAVARAIDRPTIAKALLGPLGGTPKPLDNHIFMTNQDGYEANAGDLTTGDAAAAGAELEALGWVAGADGVRAKDGQRLSLRVVVPSGVSSAQQESELIQGMLAEAGIEAQIQGVPSADFFERYVNVGDFDLVIFTWIGTPFPVSSSQSIYQSVTGDDVRQNYGRVGSPEVDAAIAAATAELDPARKAEVGNALDKAIWAAVHSLTMYQRPDLAACNEKLQNFGAKGFATVDYTSIGFSA